MTPIITIVMMIFILDRFINKNLIKKLNMEEPEAENKYVNDLHRYGEGILYWITMIVMVISMIDFHYLRFLIFLSGASMFAFRTFMEWKYTRENRSYLLSAVTCGLFILGSIAYWLYNMAI